MIIFAVSFKYFARRQYPRPFQVFNKVESLALANVCMVGNALRNSGYFTRTRETCVC